MAEPKSEMLSADEIFKCLYRDNMKRIILSLAALIVLTISLAATPYSEKKIKAPKKSKIENLRCPNNCGRHGTCRSEGCICDPGYTGAGCKIKIPESRRQKG